MDNYYINHSAISSLGDGNHINQPPEDSVCESVEMDKCPTCGEQAPANDIKNNGECDSCMDKFYQEYLEGKK